MLIHIQLQLPAAQEQTKTLCVAYLTSWQNSSFGYKLRTIEAENPSKVKNSEPQLKNLLVLI